MPVAPHTIARLATGAVRTWGAHSQGQLGDTSTADRALPVVVAVFG